jgi:hypothetical protein
VDVLGPVVTAFRPRGAYTALGQIHTPHDAADALARLTFMPEVPPPGASFDDPAAGTGGLLRPAAQLLREAGRDPADYLWSMGDIDALSAACCATNAMIWGLGPHVLVFHGNSLAQGDGPRLAAERRASVLDHHAQLVDAARLMAATRHAEHLLNQRIGNQSAPPPGPEPRQRPGRGRHRRQRGKERAEGRADG